MITIQDRQIERALIVDDEPRAREAYEYVVEDMGVSPYKVVDGLHDGMNRLRSEIQPGDVVLCDFHLKKRNYAPYNGDQVLANCFQANVPGVLCTTYADPWIRRDCLRYVPGIVRTDNPQPSDLHSALERCVRELEGDFQPDRRAWRTLVRVDDIDRDQRCFYAVVPAWNVRTKVRIYSDNVPTRIRELIEPDRYFHAVVNTGAESARDLFFDDWEPE